MVKKITAVLFTSDVAACVRFWTGRLGFELDAEVPGSDGPVFAALQSGATEVMVQSLDSMKDQPENMRAGASRGSSYLFLEVEDLDKVLTAMAGVPVVKEVYATFYGSREFTVQAPGGHFITFAQFPPSTTT